MKGTSQESDHSSLGELPTPACLDPVRPPVLFQEAGGAWGSPPVWADYMVQVGLGWQPSQSAARRVMLVSMPCDSAAAGLVALGLMIRDLGRETANDVEAHFETLLSRARQYLASCRGCRYVCCPKTARCGYLSQASGRVRSTQRPKKTYLVKAVNESGERSITFEHKGCDVTVFARGAVAYYLDGALPLIIAPAFEALDAGLYRRIAGDRPIVAENLQKSFAGLCLVTRVAGEAATRRMLESVRFKAGPEECTIADLLAVRNWSASNRVTRTNLFNTRTGRHCEAGEPPRVVVADGADATLRVLSSPDFQSSDVIGVIDRTIDRAKLDQIGGTLTGMSQWYSRADSEAQDTVLPPRGICALTLTRLP